MPANKSQKAPGDFTGRQAEKLAAKAAEDDANRERELTMVTQQQKEHDDNTIVDLTDPENPVEENAPLSGFELREYGDDDDTIEEVGEEQDSEPMVLIRLNSDLRTNVGYANNYEFEAGRRYRVPRHVAAHLDEKGYVWH